jgi:hypothetical protein
MLSGPAIGTSRQTGERSSATTASIPAETEVSSNTATAFEMNGFQRGEYLGELSDVEAMDDDGRMERQTLHLAARPQRYCKRAPSRTPLQPLETRGPYGCCGIWN